MRTYSVKNFQVTAPGASLTNAPEIESKNSAFPVPHGVKIILDAMHVRLSAAGQVQILNPQMHDAITNINLYYAGVTVYNRFMHEIEVPSGSSFQVLIAGSATAGVIESVCLILYYEDLPGYETNLLNNIEKNTYQTGKTIISGGTVAFGTTGGYCAKIALSTFFPGLKHNKYYALQDIGLSSSTTSSFLIFTGRGLGLSFPMPGNSTTLFNANTELEKITNPLRPKSFFFKGEDAGQIFINAPQIHSASNILVNIELVQLKDEIGAYYK